MKESSEWELFIKFIKFRFKLPLNSIAFVTYFMMIVVVIGLISSFIGLFETIDSNQTIDWKSISITLAGYSLVLLCSSVIEIIFMKFTNEEEEYIDLKNALTMFGFSSLILGILVTLCILFININCIRVILSCVFTVYVWGMWWITSSRSLSVIIKENRPNAMDATGGKENNVQGEITDEYTS